MFVNCASSDDATNSVLPATVSIDLVDGEVDRVAGNTITANSVVANYSGTLFWKIEYNYLSVSDEYYRLGDSLSLILHSEGDYIITLTDASGAIYDYKEITATRPIYFKFDSLTLRSIPQDYTGLYFKIRKFSDITSTYSYVYTSVQKDPVQVNPDATVWDTASLNDYFVTDQILQEEEYSIEIYLSNPSGGNTMIAKMYGFQTYEEVLHGTFYPVLTQSTQTTNCGSCHDIEIEYNFSFF